jgi:hypothetical protein
MWVERVIILRYAGTNSRSGVGRNTAFPCVMISLFCMEEGNRVSSVGIVTRLQAEYWNRGSIPCRGKNFFFLLRSVGTDCGAHHASWPVGTEDISPGLKRPGARNSHSSPSDAEINTLTVLMTRCLIKHRGNFTFSTLVLSLSFRG